MPALVSATGILITEIAASGLMPAFIRLGLPASTFVRLGMLILGAGIGLAITRNRITRLIAATALGLSFAVIYTWRTTDHYHWAFAAVLLWWALTAVVHTIRSASPLINSHLQRLIG
jgi:hypothetical protein